MLPSYLLLDLETTGGNPVADRITEVAAVRVEDGREVVRWSTLVNPGVPISAFIQSLTGIHDQMVADAPHFEDIAQRLLELMDGAVLVAHNARFDYGFLKNAFERLGIVLRTKSLCTVRLSRALYPHHRSHGLDAIMERHGLQTMARHRAMGDVEVVQAWLAVAARELGPQRLTQAALDLVRGPSSLPPMLETAVRDIPNGPGVYLFYGESAQPLYIGKSVRLRERVLSHFSADHQTGRDMRLAQETRRVEVRQTAGEFGALLLEARLIREMQPAFNRKLRQPRQLCAWRVADNVLAPLVTLVQQQALLDEPFDQLFGLYRSKRAATEALSALADAHGLCPKLLGMESGTGRCFAFQLGRCRGVCCGHEKPELHRLRLLAALSGQRLASWPHPGRIGLREFDATTGRTDIHVFEHWCHVATVHHPSDLADAMSVSAPLVFDPDTYQLLRKQLLTQARPGTDLIRFPQSARFSPQP